MTRKKEKEPTRAEAMEIYHQDGILEVVAGAVMLNVGLDILNEATFTSLFTYVPIVLMSSMKNQITIPRIGYDAFNGDEIKVRNWNLFAAIAIVLVLVAISVFVLGEPKFSLEDLSISFGRYLPSLLQGLILALGCLAGAVLIPLNRFYLYAAAALALGILGLFFFPPQAAAFAFAGVLLGNGARLMIRFARKHPLDKDQDNKKEKDQ